jgi:hypothetical protein
VVIHYELPWNPARLEQRAGRVDRLGQERRVHEIAFVAADTAERLVIAPLAVRSAQSRRAPGTSPLLRVLTDTDIARAVMEQIEPRTSQELNAASARSEVMSLTTEASDEAARLSLERRWRMRSDSAHGRRDSRMPIVSRTTLRRSPMLKIGTIRIYVLAIEDRDGRRIHGEPLVIHAADSARADATDAGITQLVDQLTAAMKARVSVLDAQARAAIAHREVAVRSVRTSAARALVQPDLFARRISRRPPESDTPPLFTGTTSHEPVLHATHTQVAVLHVRSLMATSLR